MPRVQHKHVRIYWLGACLVLLLGVTVVLLPSDPLIAARLSSLQHSSPGVEKGSFDPDAAAKMDVPMGIPLPQVGAGKAIQAWLDKSPKGVLVVGLGDCASCIRFDFHAWQKQAAALHVPLIGFSGATPITIAAFRRSSDIKTPICFDEKNAFGATENSYWGGRVFYFAPDGKLAWRMKGFGNPYTLDEQPGLKEQLGGRR